METGKVFKSNTWLLILDPEVRKYVLRFKESVEIINFRIKYQESSIGSERFKTRAGHFPIWRDERTGMQRATLGKSSSEAVSQLQGRIARAFSSNSLVNTMDMTAAVQHILAAAQSLGSQVYYKKSRMTILGLAGVLFCENEQA